MANLSDAGANLIAGFEGFRSCPYRDAVGVWTIGYGSTRGVGPGTPCVTKAQALARLKSEVSSTYGAAVNGLGLPLNQNQFDALCSFVYNCGPGAIAASTSVGRLLRARNWAGAANALLAWNRAGGRVLPGLTARRQAERTLFLRPAATAPAPGGPRPGTPPFPGRLLKVGVSGADVRAWQAQMAHRGWHLAVDGAYGPASANVCRQFQTEKRLTVDGVVGAATWAATWEAPIT